MSQIIHDFETVITTTRSVRKRLDFERPVAVEVLRSCLELALQAPTGGNAEDWRFILVGHPELKKRVGDLYRRSFDEYVKKPLATSGGNHLQLAGRLGGVQADGSVSSRTARIIEGAVYLATNIHRSPWLVIPCATRPNPSNGKPGTTSALYGSIYPAIWSFQLALRSRGLGSVITSLHLNFAEEVANILSIPVGITQVALLPVAYTVGLDFKPAVRRSVDTVTFVDGWNRSLPNHL